MTTEQWAFCTGLGTGAGIFVVGMVFGALFLYVILLWRSEVEQKRRHKTWRDTHKEFTDSLKTTT